jgi:hypothetical protein
MFTCFYVLRKEKNYIRKENGFQKATKKQPKKDYKTTL